MNKYMDLHLKDIYLYIEIQRTKMEFILGKFIYKNLGTITLYLCTKKIYIWSILICGDEPQVGTV